MKVTARSPAHPADSLPEPRGQGAVPAHGVGRGLLGGHADRCWLGRESLCLGARCQASTREPGRVDTVTGCPVCWAGGLAGPGRQRVLCSACSV